MKKMDYDVKDFSYDKNCTIKPPNRINGTYPTIARYQDPEQINCYKKTLSLK